MSCDNVLVLAGEASGDQHAAALVNELKGLRPNLHVWAVGGERLEQAGTRILVKSSELSVVGITEVFNHLRPILSAYKKITRWLSNVRPNLLILVDFPEFNLLVARKAKALGIPVFYYISPQIWAWRQKRVKRIKRLVDKMAVILPFEKDFYRRHGMDVEFVGHPLLDSVKTRMKRDEFFSQFDIPPSRRLVCLLPGSRAGEIKRHIELFLETVVMLSNKVPGLWFCLPIAPGLQDTTLSLLKRKIEGFNASTGPEIYLVEGQAYEAMSASELIVAASGTVTLEAAILRVPMIVTYKVSPLSYQLGKKLVKVDWVSLVNLIAGREVVPEFLQDNASPEYLSETAKDLLEDHRAREKMISGLEEVVRSLGDPGAAKRAAALAASMLDKVTGTPMDLGTKS